MRPIKRAIILCWIMLVACFAIKLFGGNWFEVVCTNEHFSNLCEFIDQNMAIQNIVGLILYFSSTLMFLMATCFLVKINKKQFIYLCLSLIVVWISQFINMSIKTILELINTITIPIVLDILNKKDVYQSIKKKWYWGILGYALVLLFQIISLITRNVGINYTDYSFLVTTILMIDYYIMIVLHFLYIKNRKEIRENG